MSVERAQSVASVFRREAGRLRMSERVAKFIEERIRRYEAMYPSEVPATVASIVDRSFVNLANHSVGEFVEYGDYGAFDIAVEKMARSVQYGAKPKPQIVVLYGPPGTGKTTWVRNAAARHLVRWAAPSAGVLDAVYLEVMPGDTTSKYAGIPIFVMRCALDLATGGLPSVVLIDEADGLFVKPKEVSFGVDIEQQKLVSELKSSLAMLMSMSIPVVIVLTTNYRDALASADPAIGDRVSAWIEVPPPPLRARERMVAKLLPKVFRSLWTCYTPAFQAHVLRFLLGGGDIPAPATERTRRGAGVRAPYVVPVLAFEADYLVGYLIAWGWSPLDGELRQGLTLDFARAVALWDEGNPLLRVYARGLLSEIEMLRRFNEEKHGVSKSFLRTLHMLRNSLDDLEKLFYIPYSTMYYYLESAAREAKLGGEGLRKELELLGRRMAESLGVHPVQPSHLHHSLSKQTSSQEFVRVVNRVLTTAGVVANAIRQLYLPFLLTLEPQPGDRYADIRRRLGLYNRFVVEELERGRLLEPLRIMLEDGQTERAWSAARRSLEGLEPDLRPYVGMAVAVARILHRAIHEGDAERKGAILYSIYRDVDRLEGMLVEAAAELGVKGWIPVVYDSKSIMFGGIAVGDSKYWVAFDPTLFNSSYTNSDSRVRCYSVAPVVGEMGIYMAFVVDRVVAEEGIRAE